MSEAQDQEYEEVEVSFEDGLLLDNGIEIEDDPVLDPRYNEKQAEKAAEAAGVKETDDETATPTAEQGQAAQVAEAPQQGQQQPEHGTGTVDTSNHEQVLQKFARTRLAQDAAGNLVDPVSRAVVARAGAERYFFEQARNVRGYAGKLEQRVNDMASAGQRLEAQIKAYDQMNTEARNAGLTMEDQGLAVKLFAMYKTDPVTAVKYILTQAAANGTDLSSVLEDTSGLNLGAITAAIDQKLQPFLSKQKAADEADELTRQAEQQGREFIQRHPDVEVHLDTIIKIIDRDKVDPETAYYRLRTWAAENQLDWSQPLADQMRARLQKQDEANGQQQQPQTPTSMPGGRVHQTVAQATEGNKDASMAANASVRDIVREAMRENGYNI